MNHPHALRTVVGALLLACAGVGAQAAAPATQLTTYFSTERAVGLAYVIAWDTSAHTAHIVETFGNFDGAYVDDGDQRIFTLAQPLVLTEAATDCNGDPMTQTDTTTQLVFRNVSGGVERGLSAVAPIGYLTDVGGCTPGLVTPYGSTTDAGYPLVRQAMSLRPSMADLVPGTQIAGMSEDPIDTFGDLPALSAQTTTFGAGSITFDGSGDTYPTTTTPDGWLVIDYGTFQRGYMRIKDDGRTGGETWFGAEWQNGAPASIELSTMIEPNAAAGFRGRGAAAQQWASGLFAHDPSHPMFDLYHDYTGQRTDIAADGSTESSPLTWTLAGTDLQIMSSSGGYDLVRTWHPIADIGKTHFVLENEEAYQGGADVGPVILARVNWYVDGGKAVEPAARRAQVGGR